MTNRETHTLGQIPSFEYLGQTGFGKVSPRFDHVTQDSGVTGWNASRYLLSSPKVSPSIKDMIRRQDYGGSFMSERTSWTSSYDYEGTSIPVVPSYKPYGTGYLSGFVVPDQGSAIPTFTDRATQSVELFGFGGDAWRATAPTREQVSLAQDIGELREGLPGIPGSHLVVSRDLLGFLRTGSGEYLNYQFGIRPLVSDLRAAALSVLKSVDVLNQLKRDSGKQVRRRLTLPPEVLTNRLTGSWGPSVRPVTYYFSSTGDGTCYYRLTKVKWFSAAFTYVWPQVNDTLLSKFDLYAEEARVLLGIKFDASVVWQVTRFSWLVDWFANLGGILNGLSLTAHDQLVAPHAYAMSHYSGTAEIHSGYQFRGLPPFIGVLSMDRKMRIKASPYGFDVLVDKLTAFQTSILVALGINRAPLALLHK